MASCPSTIRLVPVGDSVLCGRLHRSSWEKKRCRRTWAELCDLFSSCMFGGFPGVSFLEPLSIGTRPFLLGPFPTTPRTPRVSHQRREESLSGQPEVFAFPP